MFAIMEPCYLPTQEQMTDGLFCIIDLKKRKHIRANYPGACSLEYQNVMDVVKTVLVGWNNKKKEGSRGLFGIPSAYTDGCEEQGRKTLHYHMTIFVKNFNTIRNAMLSSNPNIWSAAREEMTRYFSEISEATLGQQKMGDDSCTLLAPTHEDVRNMRHSHHSKTMGGFVAFTEKESDSSKFMNPEMNGSC